MTVFIPVSQKIIFESSKTVLPLAATTDGIYPCFPKITVAIIIHGSHHTDDIWPCFSKIFTSFVTRYFPCFSELSFENSNRKMFTYFILV
jgi:hypothetical protein